MPKNIGQNISRIMITLVCALIICGYGLAENVSRTPTAFTATGANASISLVSTGVYNHLLTWTGSGTRTTCSIKVEQSANEITWTDLIAAQNCATDGSATAAGYANFVRINVTTLTGAGNTVYARYDGTPVAIASSGTFTCTGCATATLQSNGSQKTQIVNSSGTTIETFGGGTQYATGAAKGTSTGTLSMLSDGALIQNWLAGIALGDGVNGNNMGAVVPWVFNGTTWDRTRSGAGLGSILVNNGTAANLKGQFTLMDGTGAANDATHGIYVLPVTAGFPVSQVSSATNPCLTDAVVTIPINQSASATVIAASGSTAIHICGGVIVAVAAETVLFEGGTGTVCATGTHVKSGVIPLDIKAGFLIQPITLTASDGFCIVQGSTVDVDGYISYVQK